MEPPEVRGGERTALHTDQLEEERERTKIKFNTGVFPGRTIKTSEKKEEKTLLRA